MAEAEFADWYRRERPRVIAALSVLSGEPEVAHDATDEAFTRAYAHWGRVSRMASPGGWTYRVALNALRRSMRQRRPLVAAVGDLPAYAVPEVDIDLWQVVASLPERQRTAIVLRYVADLPERDIATAMGIRRGTVSATLAQARARLAELLGTDDEQPQRTNHA